ncbi:hypothetical protein pEaSNUABM56_00086 [Erwinia phage pEa_SNUABM_56]|uniref:Uncharacterized protein n=1 Tax=Erwinia phage pEp_SNUABM_01 TaxID=2601643 RepID=A0A5J6DBL6_9CAUD|nr:hypothetical protein HWC63_gp059 [Erwinia phage pEp_SNUABM_01]QEQ94885.1 hypothetical protein pEpSNUABM01_059 [Erwinia phage pEp_SNUABM_01]UYL84816.1 hypothetical protein pEaSNUABM55_00018 [Erwinia phage pEa_SNUABM_55]UYL85131.1 hypothetical protein pEaSNUABM56_00086 [Erwinia phage pEa_SNUABM_56]
MKMVLGFIVAFFFIMLCFVGLAFCGGMQFGTPPFGWLMGFGVMIGVFCGVGVAAAIDHADL